MPTRLLTLDVMNKLVSHKEMVSGLILHPNNETLEHFSHENKCPNQFFSLETAQCPVQGWNPWGKFTLEFSSRKHNNI